MKNLQKKLMLVVMACGMGMGVSSSFANEELEPQQAPYLCYACQHDTDGYDCKWRVCHD